MLQGGAALAALGASPAASAAAGDTQPLWLVSEGRAKVYLYGNAGSATPKWSAPRVEAAFAESAVFWKETPDQRPEDRPKFAAAGVDLKRPLSTWLTPEQREEVAKAATEAGTTFAALEPLKPWLASLSLGEAYGRRNRRPPMEDPLQILTGRAKAAGKPIRTEFPDVDSQLAFFAGMSQAAQVEFLFYTIENSRLAQDVIDRRRAAWAAGDLSLETHQVAHLKEDFPHLYEPFELVRNRAWPARFRTMIEEGGTSFVLVGADHLVGPDSVLVQLEASGMTPRRV